MERDFNGYDYVDLGLPSGTLWAKYNVGATNEEDYGLYFAWGETVGYTKEQIESGVHSFLDDTYQLGSAASITTNLSGDNDAATVNMSGSWRMPTTDDTMELFDYTTQKVAVINGVKGVKFISKADSSKYVFFPFAGFAGGYHIFFEGGYGGVWLSIIDDSDIAFSFSCSKRSGIKSYRLSGRSVRGVIG